MSGGRSGAPAAAHERGNRRLAFTALGLVMAFVLAALILLGGGGDDADRPSAVPPQAAMGLIPAGALVALHLSTDASRPAVRRAGRIVARLPSWPKLRNDLLSRLEGRGCGIDLRKDAGKEVAFALLPGRGGTASPLLVTDAPARGLPRNGAQPCGALVVQRIAGLVAIGEPDALAAAVAVAAGRRAALVRTSVYKRAAKGLARERVISAWASGAGARRLLLPIGGLLGTLASLIEMPGLQGAVASVVADGQVARITVRRVSRRGVDAPAFTPTLQRSAPAGTISYTASGDLAGGLRSLLLLNRASALSTLDELAGGGNGALKRLADQVPESAFVVGPGPDGPVITLLARVRDGAKARAAVRDLEPVLGRLIGAPAGAAFSDADLDGPARRLDIAGSTLAYRFADEVLAISTAPSGLQGFRAGAGRLGTTAEFRRVASELPRRVTSLVFFDPNQLLRLGVDTGTGLEDTLQDVRDDLARVRAIGIHASGTGGSSTVELSLSIP